MRTFIAFLCGCRKSARQKTRIIACLGFLTTLSVATWPQAAGPSALAEIAQPPTAPPDAARQAAQPKVPLPPSVVDLREDRLRQFFVGKTLYLRGGYLDNTLNFDEHGRLIGHSPQGSYTLSAIQITRVRLSKHKAEFEGQRYALHFVGSLPYSDPMEAADRIKITPKKKVVKISLDREQTEKAKKSKKDQHKGALIPVNAPPIDSANSSASPFVDGSASPNQKSAQPSPAELKHTPTVASEAHAAGVLQQALDRVFAQGIDERMIADLPDFWKLYFMAAAAKTDYRPADPGIFRQTTVDQRARLLSKVDPPSNEYAQANNVAGIAMYHAVIGPDGVPKEIVAGRPIGFGLDESAVAIIRKATFQPAIKDGKPVPVWLDLVVQFRIYSKRTSASATEQALDKAPEPVLPGPYSLQPLMPVQQ